MFFKIDWPLVRSGPCWEIFGPTWRFRICIFVEGYLGSLNPMSVTVAYNFYMLKGTLDYKHINASTNLASVVSHAFFLGEHP
jgi:hypothetical protein